MNLCRKRDSTAEGLSRNHSYVLLQSKSLGIFELNRIFKIKASSYLLEIAKMQFIYFFKINTINYDSTLSWWQICKIKASCLVNCASLVQQ